VAIIGNAAAFLGNPPASLRRMENRVWSKCKDCLKGNCPFFDRQVGLPAFEV